ncbi:EAL domain-containing protein [Pseudomonas fluorescens]|nr:EAL domain-containing protein [Pseudomonas fluorescens]
MALPSLLLNLGQQGVLSQLPHVLWCSDSTSGVLDSHAQLARDAGVSVQVVPSLSSDTAQDVLKVLAKGHSNGSQYVASDLCGVTDQELLKALLANLDIRIVLQPQVDLITGKYVGAEALARWQHPVLGNISPSVFVPLANNAGLNVLLFHYVEAKVVALLRRLKKLGIAIPISANASAITLCTPGLANRLEQRLKLAEVPNSLFKIELTEDVPIDDMLPLSTALCGLRLRGFSVAMDDFGCGASTLNLLTRLPFSELKIDGRFVRGMAHKPGCRAAVSGAIAIAREMKLEFVAEGIETPEQIETLLDAGCRVGQGFALSPPLEVNDFIRALASNAQSA